MGSKWLLPGAPGPRHRPVLSLGCFRKPVSLKSTLAPPPPVPMRVHGGGGGGTVLVYWVLVQTTPGSHEQGEPLMINSGPGP